MNGVRIELTMLPKEPRGYGPLDHRWSLPVRDQKRRDAKEAIERLHFQLSVEGGHRGPLAGLDGGSREPLTAEGVDG